MTSVTRDHHRSLAEAEYGELAAAICLSLVKGVGPRLGQQLIDRFGTAHDVLAAPPSALREVPGVGPDLAHAIAAAQGTVDWQSELDYCRRHGIAIYRRGVVNYPRLLAEIHDPPPLLYWQGDRKPEDTVAVAIVGTRHATTYGLRMARQLAGQLARCGVAVVSGLARGVDAAAHEGALEAGGRTIAVLAHGLRTIYPAEHKELADRVQYHGGLATECAPRATVHRGGFPRRNRIISGLSLGVVVIEAGDRSGALITARLGMEQGREVFALPGQVDSRVSRGCHGLLRDGAHLVESVDDVLSQLGPLVERTPCSDGTTLHHPAELVLNDQERLVLQAVSTEPTNIDQIVMVTELPVQRVLATISALEMRRLLRRVSGHTVVRPS